MRCFLLILITTFSLYGQRPGSGSTLNFNGVNQYVDLNSSFGTITFPLTVTVWFKPDINQVGPIRFFSSHDMTGAYRGILFHYLNGDIDMLCGNGVTRGPSGRFGFKATYPLTSGRWHHIAFVLNSPSSAQCYVNGVAINTVVSSSATGSPVLSSDNSNGRLGANTAGNNITYLSGQMDEFSFWSKALTQNEVRDMMCQKLSGNEPNLMAYYRFDDGVGNSITNLVSGGPDGTLRNGPTWVLSSAPVGDRSFHNNYIAGADAQGRSLSGDNVIIHPTHIGTPGTHLYFVDSKPTNTAGIYPVLGIDYYFGVFNADFPKVYDLYVNPSGTSASFPNNTLQLATRPHNASPQWTPTLKKNTPNYLVPGETPMCQYIIAFAGCPPMDILPGDSTACDSLRIDLSRFINHNWSSGSTSNTNTFYKSGEVWVSVEDPVSKCVYIDTIEVNIVNSNNQPKLSVDTVLCGVGSFTYDISLNGASRYEWFDGNNQTTRTFNKDGSYWFKVYFPGGCSISDTLRVKFPSIALDPIEEEEFYLCGQDTAEVYLRHNTYQNVLWSNGTTSRQSSYWNVGKEWVITQTVDGCWQTDSFEILQTPPLSDQAIFKDTSVCAGQILVLSPPSGYTATWPNGRVGDFWVSSSRNIRVELSDGCNESVEYFKVTEYSCECDVKLPNAFTPDGDGLNDFFGPATKCQFVEYEMQIFNRFGEQIFYSADPDLLFDGSLGGADVPIGVYVFTFKYKTPHTSGTERGYFTLIR